MKTLDLANYGPVIPVIVIDKVEDAVPMAEALLEGGIKVLEVTLRTSCAIEAMDRIIKHLPEAIVGAGTVRTKADASAAKSIGCQFAVSPGYTSEIGKHCLDIGLPLLPGVSTGSEVMMAKTQRDWGTSVNASGVFSETQGFRTAYSGVEADSPVLDASRTAV